MVLATVTATTVMSLHHSSPIVSFTTPSNYAGRLSGILQLNGYNPLWCPTLIVEPTPQTIDSFMPYLLPHSLDSFAAIAFTSRTAITSFSDAATGLKEPPLSPFGEVLSIAALGKDAELIDSGFVLKVCKNLERIRVLVPQTATPSGLVKALGNGFGRKVLCPVPLVVGLTEPPVVPNFLTELKAAGWIPIRVSAYETRWAGPQCAEKIVKKSESGELDVVLFTSSAEVEGLLKSLKELGLDFDILRKRCPEMVVAAHGPVTAAGVERFGIKVDVVSSKFDSFDGIVNALNLRYGKL